MDEQTERNNQVRNLYRKMASRYSTDYNRLRKYGVSPAQFEDMLLIQNNVCAICKKEETQTRDGQVRRLNIDHCHTTGKVRGLLCSKCNQALGNLREDPEIIRSLLQYVEERCQDGTIVNHS